MKTQDTNYWKIMLVAIGILSATGTVLGQEITPEVTARWWQWVFSIPSSVHPLSQKDTDPTGAGYCMVGQQGGEWFLGGVFKIVDVSLASKQAQSAGPRLASKQAQSAGSGADPIPIEIVRECRDIPLGKTILIPVLNGECNTAEELALGKNVPKDLLGKTRYLRDCAKTLADAVDTRTAVFGPVDSRGNWIKNDVRVNRVYTVLPFSIAYSPDNILSSNCPTGTATEPPFLCAPDPNPSLAQVDGYWAQVRPSKPGTYKLQTFGQAKEFDFALNVTYTLTVVGPNDQ